MTFYLKILNFGRLSFMLDKTLEFKIGVLERAWTKVFKPADEKYHSTNTL